MRRHDLLINDPEFIMGFMQDHAFLITEMNQSSIHMMPGFRDRYWTTVITAYYLKSLMAEQPESRTRNPALLSAVNDVIRHANAQASRMAAPPVRYEPFVLWMHGQPGTGKSHMIEKLMVDCLENIKVTYAGTPVYVRSPHSKFFNGYYGNPGCLIDDANAVDAPDILPTMISEFQAMKTCAQMRIEKPRLEEKDAEFTSIILGICSNLDSWKSTTIRDTNAFLRRRDCLVQVVYSPLALDFFEKNPKFHRSAATLPPEIRNNNAHILFHVAENPVTMITTKTFSYDEFQAYLLKCHAEYHAKEQEKMIDRYYNSLRLAKSVAPRVMDRTTLKAALVATLVGNTSDGDEVPLETLRRKYHEMSLQVPAEFKRLPKHTQRLLKSSRMLETQRFRKLVPGIHSNPYASNWFRDHLPEYFASSGSTIDDTPPSVYNQIIRGFTPWTTEQYVEFLQEDAITSQCYVCMERKQHQIGALCTRSTASNQHYMCSDCYKQKCRFSPFSHPPCDICKSDTLIELTPNDISWRWYHKLGHILAHGTHLTLTPVRMSLDFLWDHAINIALGMITLSTLAMSSTVIYSCVQETLSNARLNEKFNEFINLTGALPTSYQDLQDGSWIFVVDEQHYKMENGQISPLINTLASQVGKKKDKTKHSAKFEIDSSPSTPTPTEFLSPSVTPPQFEKSPEIEINEVKKKCSLIMTLPPIEIMKTLPHMNSCSEHPDGEGHQVPNIQTALKSYIVHEDSVEVVLDSMKNASITFPIKYCTTCEDYNAYIYALLHGIVNKEFVTWQSQFFRDESLDDCVNLNSFLRSNFLLHEEQPKTLLHKISSPFKNFVQFQREFLLSISSNIYKTLKIIYEWICKRLYYIISVICIIFCLFYGYKYKYNEEDGYSIDLTSETASVSAGNKYLVSKRNQTRTYSPRTSPPVNAQSEMYVHTQIPQGVTSRIETLERNLVILSCGQHFNKGICISGSKFLFPRHSLLVLEFAQKKQGALIIEQEGFLPKKILKNPIRDYLVCEWKNEDLVMLEVPGVTGKSIVNQFKKQTDMEVTYPPFGYVFDVTDKKVHTVRILSVEDKEPLEVPYETVIGGETVKYTTTLPVYISIEGVQGSGKCISPLMIADGTIIGLHMAGEAIYGLRRGYHVPVFRHMFETSVKSEIGNFPNLKVMYRMDKSPWANSRSQIRPSFIASNAWKSLTEPCIQSKDDVRYKFTDGPLLDGAASIGEKTIPPDPALLHLAMNGVMEELFKYMPNPTMKVPVSIQEAVTAENHSNVESMNLSTSAGIPLILAYPTRTKKCDYIFDRQINDTRVVALDPEFEEMYDQCYAQRINMMPPRQPFCAHLKDERRTSEKVISFSGTRVFHMAPLELTLTSRRVLLPFMDAFHSDPVKLHHAIGLSPDSPQWTRLIESLRYKSSKIVQLDFKKFSDSMPTEFIQAAFNIIREYYLRYGILTVDVDNVLHTLFYETARPVVAIQRIVYELLNGTLQGHPLTSIINSLVNLIEQVYVWMVLTQNSPSEFFENCGIVVMGDDVVISVPSRMLDRYNGALIASAFKAMAIIVTDESKDMNNIQKWQPIKNFDFISRSYALHPFRELYLAPADLSSVFDTPLWIKRKDDPLLDATLENVEQSLLLMFGHGPLIYEMYRSTLRFLTEGRITLRSWYDMDYQFYGKEGFIERSIINLAHADATGSSSHSSPLEAGAWLTGQNSVSGVAGVELFGENFLNNARLDTQGTVIGYYRCDCRYNCEYELLKRIKEVEIKTKVPKERFLPFTSQEAGIWASRPLPPSLLTDLTSSGCASIIATKVTSDPCDLFSNVVDGTRDRVLKNSFPKTEMSFTIQDELDVPFPEDISLTDLDNIDQKDLFNGRCSQCIEIGETGDIICLENI
nr:polyprotein [Flumine iflavirus 2]